MSARDALLALLMMAAPLTALAQPCVKPTLADTEIKGWHKNDDSIIVGTASYRIYSPDAPADQTVRLGIAFSHSASDESHNTGEPTPSEVEKMMPTELQFRLEPRDRSKPRTFDATDAQVNVDGKVFPSRFDVQGADNRMHALAVNWQVWYSDANLIDALEHARNVEVTLLSASGQPVAKYGFDVSSLKPVRRKLLPYFRCTAIPYHVHAH